MSVILFLKMGIILNLFMLVLIFHFFSNAFTLSQETYAKLLSMMFDTSTKVLGRLIHYVDQESSSEARDTFYSIIRWIAQ